MGSGLKARLCRNLAGAYYPVDAVYGDFVFRGALPGNLQDPLSYRESIRKIKDYQKQHNAEIWFSHDSGQFELWKRVPFLY